jgi:hypothetical protein
MSTITTYSKGAPFYNAFVANINRPFSLGPGRVPSNWERARLRLVGAINFLPADGGEKSTYTWVDEAEDRRKYALPPMPARTIGLPRAVNIDGPRRFRGATEAERN